MEETQIKDAVIEVASDILEIPCDEITLETGYGTCSEWDSLAQITILASVESEFNLKFDATELTEVKTVKDIISLVESKVN